MDSGIKVPLIFISILCILQMKNFLKMSLIKLEALFSFLIKNYKKNIFYAY